MLVIGNANAVVRFKAPEGNDYTALIDTFSLSISTIPDSPRPLVVTLGETELITQLSTSEQTPILALLINSSTYYDIIESFKLKPHGPVTAIFSDPDPRLQIQLARALAPGKSIMIAGTAGVTNDPLKTISEFGGQGIDLLLYAKGDIKPLIADMDRYDVLIAVPDSNIYNVSTIQSIITSLYRREKFIIGYSIGMVKAGSLASVISSKDQMALQLRFAISQYLSTGALPPPSFPTNVSVAVNKSVARSLGIVNTDEVELQKKLTNTTHAGGNQ